jgi:tetratricopeptide (TPR) repeat protein
MENEKISEIKDLISSGKNEEAMRIALDYFKGINPEKEKNIRLLLNQLKRVQKDIILGVSNESIELNRIISSFLTEVSKETDNSVGLDVLSKKESKYKYFIPFILLIIMLMSVKIYSNLKYSNESLVNKYRESTMISFLTHRSSSYDNPTFNKAVDLFEVGNYRESIEEFTNLKEIYPEIKNKCEYAIACNYLFLGEFEESADRFTESLDSIESQIREDHAKWGIILSNLGKGAFNRSLLKNLEEQNLNRDWVFQSYSKQLERDLKSIWRKIAKI